MVSGKYTGGVLTVSVTGKIDSANADAVENEINELRKNEHVALVIDFENLEYISSAGLRVILRLKRSEKDMKVANVSNDVYDIFEMTGFTEMMPVENMINSATYSRAWLALFSTAHRTAASPKSRTP